MAPTRSILDPAAGFVHSMASVLQGLRRTAPRLSRDFFMCRQCMNQSRPAIQSAAMRGRSAFPRKIQFQSTAASPKNESSPLSSLSRTIDVQARITSNKISSKKFFPETSSKSVAYWLLGSAASVFGIVIFGGLTRLTESGYVRSLRCY